MLAVSVFSLTGPFRVMCGRFLNVRVDHFSKLLDDGNDRVLFLHKRYCLMPPELNARRLHHTTKEDPSMKRGQGYLLRITSTMRWMSMISVMKPTKIKR